MLDNLDALKKGTEAQAARLRGMIDLYVRYRSEAATALSAAASNVARAEERYRSGLASAAPNLLELSAELANARDAHRAAQEQAAKFAQAPANPSDALLALDGPHRKEAQALEQAAVLELSEHLVRVGELCAELEAVLDRARQLPELIDLARGILPVSMRTNYEPATLGPRVVLTVNTDGLSRSLRPKRPRGPLSLRLFEGV